jgi:hypothetical protein
MKWKSVSGGIYGCHMDQKIINYLYWSVNNRANQCSCAAAGGPSPGDSFGGETLLEARLFWRRDSFGGETLLEARLLSCPGGALLPLSVGGGPTGFFLFENGGGGVTFPSRPLTATSSRVPDTKLSP